MKFTRIKHIHVDGLYGHINCDIELPYYNTFITGDNGNDKTAIFESIASKQPVKRFSNISVELYNGKSFKTDGNNQNHSEFLENAIFIDFNELENQCYRYVSNGMSVLDETLERIMYKAMEIERYLTLDENKDSIEAKKFNHLKDKLEQVMRDVLDDEFVFDMANVKTIKKNHIKIFMFCCIKTAIAAFNKNIVIYDEPEKFMRSRWQKFFVRKMRKINIKSQFIFITKSSHIASSDGMKNIVEI